MKLLIVSHVVHYKSSGGYFAYSPYAKEIELWADLFSDVTIAAPCRLEEPPADTCRIARSNVRVAPQKEVGGESLTAKAEIVMALPRMVFDLARQMWNAEAIHVRCPGNLGLLGVVLAPFFSRCLIAKYAGQWNGYPGEEWTVSLQRHVLRSNWWRGPVTVYGKNPEDPGHVIDFFSSMFSADQLSRARTSSATKRANAIPTVAFCGRLSRAKNVDVLLRAIAALKAEGIKVNGVVVGDGPESDFLRSLAVELGIADQVEFTGAIAPERVPDVLERSEIFVLASLSEGWPKSIAEAMAFGLICIGSDLGLIRTFLSEGRGLLVQPGNVEELTNALRKVASAPENYEAMRRSAAGWAQGYSLESMREGLRNLMMESWQLSDSHFLTRSEAAETR